jgi:hypothetical protein
MALTDIDGQRLGDSVSDKLGDRNLIINGAMTVAQRGTSSTANDYGSVDRIRPSFNGGSITQSQEDVSTNDSPYALGFRKFFRLTNTTALADPPSGAHHRRFLLRLEAQDIAQSGWDYTDSNSYITLSMWVRSSVGQTFTWFAQTVDGTQQSYPWDITLADNTWTPITKSFPGNSNLTIDSDNELGFAFDCAMFWGTNFTNASKTNDQWSAFSGGARTKDFDDTWAITTGATFDVTGIQLEVGNTATPFQHESYAKTLAKCQRYYQKTTFTNGYRGANTKVYANLDIITNMRASPTVDAEGVLEINGSGSNDTATSVDIDNYGTNGVNKFIIISNFPSRTIYTPASMRFQANENLLTLSAEL